MNILQKFMSYIYKKSVQYTYMSGFGKPKWSTQKDIQFVKEAYNKIVWAYSCISLISSCTKKVDWCLYRNLNNKTYEITEHPILNLLNTKVNDYLTSKDFFEIWSTYLAVQGKFFAVYNSPVNPSKIEYIYPHNTYVIPNLQDFFSGIEYRISGKSKNYDKDIVLWSKFFDPLDAYEGFSPIKAMARTIDTENEAVDWNKSTLQNAGVPPGAIQVFNPSPDLQTKLDNEWQKRYAGANNARRPLILNSEKASYVNFGMSQVDMDFLLQRKLNRVEICSGFNVPSQLVGDPEGQTYSNYKEALKSFYELTIIPKYLSNIQGILTGNLCSKFSDNLFIKPNLDNIEALQDSREILINNTRKLWKDGIIKRSEARDTLDYEFDENDNIYYTDIKKSEENNKEKSEENKNGNIEDAKKKDYY